MQVLHDEGRRNHLCTLPAATLSLGLPSPSPVNWATAWAHTLTSASRPGGLESRRGHVGRGETWHQIVGQDEAVHPDVAWKDVASCSEIGDVRCDYSVTQQAQPSVGVLSFQPLKLDPVGEVVLKIEI